MKKQPRGSIFLGVEVGKVQVVGHPRCPRSQLPGPQVTPGVLRINIGQSLAPANYPEFESLEAVNYLGWVRAILRNL